MLLWLTHAPNLSFHALTGYKDVRVWLIEEFAHLLIILSVFSFLSAFIPGEAGKWFRATMFGLVGKAFALAFKILEVVLLAGLKSLLRSLGLEPQKKEQ